jgi:hypothetical protein
MGLVISDVSDPNCCEKIDYSYGAGCTYCARRPYVDDSLGQNHIISHIRFPITSLKKWWELEVLVLSSNPSILAAKVFCSQKEHRQKKRPPEVFKNANKQPL